MADPITLNLHGEDLVVSDRDMVELHQLSVLPGWDVLQRVLATMEAGTRKSLESMGTPLDDVRYLQGCLSASRSMSDLMVGVATWMDATRKDT